MLPSPWTHSKRSQIRCGQLTMLLLQCCVHRDQSRSLQACYVACMNDRDHASCISDTFNDSQASCLTGLLTLLLHGQSPRLVNAIMQLHAEMASSLKTAASGFPKQPSLLFALEYEASWGLL